MQIYLTNFSKDQNSTARVLPVNMNEFDGQIKQDCSVMTPVITLDMSAFNDGDITEFNWCYIPVFHRYYWVSDIKFIRGLWEFYLICDVLATYRTQIYDANLYVLRAYAQYDGDIVDTLYPVKSSPDFSVDLLGDLWPLPGGNNDVGCYCIGVVSKVASYGSIQYYILSRTAMVILVTHLLDDSVITTNGFSLDDASLALQKSLIDPLSYIKSCCYLPFNIADLDVTAVSSIDIFGYTFTLPAYVPNKMRAYKSVILNVPKHPDTNSRGNYVNIAPYTMVSINVPPFGLIELDTTATCNLSPSQIGVLVTVDIANGAGRLEVVAGDSNLNTPHPVIITSVKGKVGVPISLSQVTRDVIEGATSALGTIGNLVTGNFMGAAAGIGNAVEAFSPHLSSIGKTGSFSDLWSYGGWNLTAQFFRPVEDDPVHHGRPLCKNKVLSTLAPGYVLVQDGDVELPHATKAELLEVKNYLETGIYLE